MYNEFNEYSITGRFEWPLTLADLSSHSLDIAVKNDIGLFSKSRTAMGHIVVPLSILSDPAQARTEWYES